MKYIIRALFIVSIMSFACKTLPSQQAAAKLESEIPIDKTHAEWEKKGEEERYFITKERVLIGLAIAATVAAVINRDVIRESELLKKTGTMIKNTGSKFIAFIQYRAAQLANQAFQLRPVRWLGQQLGFIARDASEIVQIADKG